MRIERL